MAINLGNNHPPSSHLTSQEFFGTLRLPANLENIGNYVLFCEGLIPQNEFLTKIGALTPEDYPDHNYALKDAA